MQTLKIFSLLKLLPPLILGTTILANQTPAFDELVGPEFHSSTQNTPEIAPPDSRSLLRSWLNARVLTCENPAYGLCPSKPFPLSSLPLLLPLSIS